MTIIQEIQSVHTEILRNQILGDYQRQRRFFPYLPKSADFSDFLTTAIDNLKNNGVGWGIFEKNTLKSFIAGYPVDNLFGESKGVYIPLYGHSFFSENRKEQKKITRQMYTFASAEWVKMGCLSHAITVYAKDPESVETWFWLGFGNRCVDSLKPCDIRNQSKAVVQIKKATKNDLEKIVELERDNHLYFRTAPLFMPAEDVNPLEALHEWFAGENRHLWIAFEGEKPVGFMRIQNEGESFISHHKSIMNITGAYVIPDKRGGNIATSLLFEVQKWLLKNNYPLLSVDFESFNVKGATFWNRHFTPYTFSLTRRIDERITAHPNERQK